MRRSDIDHFLAIYPQCSRREIQDLVNAIRNDKYWSVHPGTRDALYVVALTRASIPTPHGFRARATHLRTVTVPPEAAKYCRRGRVLVVVNRDPAPVAMVVATWPAFLRLMRLKTAVVYEMLRSGALPAFIEERKAARMSRQISSNQGGIPGKP